MQVKLAPFKSAERDPACDAAIEKQFGKPDYLKTYIQNGLIITPFLKYKLWRID